MEMKSAIRQRTLNTAADNMYGNPATPVRCKHCNRHFAMISAEGGLSPSIPHEQGCASCEPFPGLYDTLRIREQEHTSLLDRGPKHHGRILAHEQFRKARLALENFLVSVEASNNTSFDVPPAGFANRTESVSLEHAQEPVEGPKHGDDQDSLDHILSAVDHISSTAASLTTKRRLARNPGASCLERKRIKFCEDVEERPEYRGTLEYYRGAKEYTPGRYAVTEGSEYEDTSGSTISFAKFTGQRKVGLTFVDIIPKEEAQEGGNQTFAEKKRGKDSGQKTHGLTYKPDTPEKDESRMNSRELRLSRRARPSTLPATARPQRMSAQSDGHEGKSPIVSNDAPSLVVGRKVPNRSEIHALTNGDRSAPVSENTDESRRLSGGANFNETSLETTEHAVIRRIVSSIQRDLRVLHQTRVSLVYMDTVSKAVRGCFQALEPLEHLDCVQLRHTDEGECPQEEEESIYFEASDGISESTHRADGPSGSAEIMPKWSRATVHHEASLEHKVSLAQDANTLDDMPREDEQNLSGISELETIHKQVGMDVELPASFVKTDREKAKQTNPGRLTKVRFRSEHQDNHATRLATTQSHTPEEVDTVLRRRPRRASPIATLDDQSPEYHSDKVAACPSITRPQKLQAALMKTSPALLLPAISGPSELERHRSFTDNSNTCNAVHPLTPELYGNKNATDVPHENEAVTSSCPRCRTAGLDASPDHDHFACQLPVNPLEPTLDASLAQPLQCEAAGSMHQGFGKLLNVQDEEQITYTQSESEVGRGGSLFVNNDSLGIVSVGEAGEDSDVLVTDTDQHGASKDAQVDPDTAQDSADVTIINDPDLYADRKVESTSETSDAKEQDAERS